MQIVDDANEDAANLIHTKSGRLRDVNFHTHDYF